MNNGTKIEWTDATWNPVVGCKEKSEACENCYARSIVNRRLSKDWVDADGNQLVKDGRWTGKVALLGKRLEEPLRSRKPKRIFVVSMGDLFHYNVPFEFIAAVFGIMAATPQHFYYVLTKRPVRMAEFFGWLPPMASAAAYCMDRAGHHTSRMAFRPPVDPAWPLPNVMLMVTAETQARANGRIGQLFASPAAHYGVSCEPLLEHVDLPKLGLLDWVICGAEQHSGSREMNPEWARSIQRQCHVAGVPFFFKKDSRGKRALDGKMYEEHPEI